MCTGVVKQPKFVHYMGLLMQVLKFIVPLFTLFMS